MTTQDLSPIGTGVSVTASPNVVWHESAVGHGQRPMPSGPGMTVWLTGLSGSGKSTIAVELERQLVAAGRAAYVLDGDNLRHGLNADLGFSVEDRAENVRRLAEVAKLLADSGQVVVVAAVSPQRAARDVARRAHESAGIRFVEVFVDTPLEECEARDPKRLYARARTGAVADFTGVSAPYEPPIDPELTLQTTEGGVQESVQLLLELIRG